MGAIIDLQRRSSHGAAEAFVEAEREILATKRLPQRRLCAYGCVLVALAALAVIAAGVYAGRGGTFIAVCAVLAALMLLFAGYCFAAYFLQRCLPAVLIYAEGDSLFFYRYKKKDYLCVPIAQIASALPGTAPRDVRAGTVIVSTLSGEKIEAVEIDRPFAACEEILRRKAAAEVRKGGTTGADEQRNSPEEKAKS